MDKTELLELQNAIEALVAWCSRFTYEHECEEKCPFCVGDECVFKMGDNPEEWCKNRTWYTDLMRG